jgi:hypothetical protein
MKKVLFSVLVVLVLLWNCGLVFAQKKDKGRGRRDRHKQIRKARQADANETSRPVKGKRTNWQERSRKHAQEQEKWRKMERKIQGKLDAMSGKNAEHQLEVVNTKMAQEQAKHARRLARFNRIRKLAVAEDKADIVKRVDKLRQREAQRYARKYGILAARKTRLGQRKEGKGRMPTKAERDRRGKKRERRHTEADIGKRGSRGKERQESAADSNNP